MTGKIINLNWERGFGFLNSDNSEAIYFKIRDAYNNVAIGDKVVFEEHTSGKGRSANTIRKLYVNKAGVVFISRINQHHIHLNLDEYLPPIIDNLCLDNSKNIIEFEYEFPDYIGLTHCVPTKPNDKIIYCIRKGRLGHTRFIVGSKPLKCKHVFAVFKKIEIGYVILTIYIGKKAAREPWDKYANKNDLLFWRNNALIFDEEKIIAGSETEECPWVLNQPAICNIVYRVGKEESHP